MVNDQLLALFKEKSRLVSAKVEEIASLDEAYAYVIDLCGKKEACQLLVSGCEEALSPKAEDLCESKQAKVVAAPNLDEKQFSKLKKLCEKNGFVCIDSGLRKHLGGIDIGFTICDGGIAETGTLILNSNSEETRISTMVSEIHVAVLRKSEIMADSLAAEEKLAGLMGASPSYTAFITGASRTADIERVLALGVHGPLELHILLMEDA